MTQEQIRKKKEELEVAKTTLQRFMNNKSLFMDKLHQQSGTQYGAGANEEQIENFLREHIASIESDMESLKQAAHQLAVGAR